MGALAVQEQARELAGIVRSDDFVGQLELALPETVSPRRFARIAATAIQINPDLAQCDRDSVFQSLLRCAADGLVPDGREAAIVKRGGKASYMPMIGGYRKIAADFGWTLRTRAVRANDEFDWTEEPPTLTHKIARGDRGDLVYAYAVATHKDGTRLQRVLDTDQVAERRAKATTDRVWAEFTEQMWEKSAGRDLFDEIPKSDEDKARVERMLESERAYERAAADPVEALYGNGGDRNVSGERSYGGPHDADTGSGDGQAGTPAPSSQPVAAAEHGQPVEDGVWEPVDETPTPTDAEIAAAGQLQVGRGVHKGKTMRQVADEGDDGVAWLLTQLKKDDHPAELATFVHGALPETWARYQRWLETRA